MTDTREAFEKTDFMMIETDDGVTIFSESECQINCEVIPHDAVRLYKRKDGD